MKKYIGKYKKEGLPGGPNEVETTINGFIITNEGQWKYPGQPTLIPSNEITMQGVDFPVLGIDDTGHSKMMMPGADYTFPGSMVYELPMAQSGKTVSQNWQEITGTPWSKAKELGLTTGRSDQNLELRKKFLADPEYYRNLAQGREDVATVEPISVEQIDQPIASSISRENVPIQDQYRNVRQQEPENIIGAYNITPYGVEASPYTISDPRLLQLPTMVTDFENDTEGSFIGEGSWSRLGAVPLTSTTGEFAQEYFDPLTGEATGEFIPTLASSTLTASGPNAYMPDGSACAQDRCAAGMQYNIVSHLEGGWNELKNKLGIKGDAWTINENILNSGGQRIYGLGTDMDIDRSKKYSSNQVRNKLYEARKKHNLDAVYESAQVGDIVEMYYPNSSSQEEAIRTGKGDTYTTHVGHITEKGGVKYVTHNVDGTFHTDKLDTLLNRSGSRGSTKGTTVSGIIRPNYGWRDSQSGAVSISKKPVQAIAISGDRNYYTNEDQEKVSNWQLKAITPVAKQFVQGLESVAPDIAADFGLSNDQLSLIMRASFGAFGNESGFGESNTYKKKTRARRVIRGYKDIAPDWMPESDEQSEGLSQIKLENAFNDPKAKALLKKYGIKEVEQLYDPMYSSIATMLLTAMNYKQFESATGLKAEDVDPITMQNVMLLAHNKGMQNVINNDFVEEGEFKKLHQLRRKGHKYVEGQEPKLSDQSILDGLSTYTDVHMNQGSYTNKTGDFAASLNIDMSRLFAEKGDREAYVGQEAPEAYSLGETLLDQAHGLLSDRDYAGDKEKLLAAIESAKIKAIKNAEKLHKGSKQKLSRALSKIERDSRKAINEIQNAGEKAVNRVRSTFEEGGNVNNKIYIGQYTMGPNKYLGKAAFPNGGPTDPPSNLPKAQLGKYIPTWANPYNRGVEDYTDKYKTWDEAYAAAKKAGLTEIMWNKGPNPGRKNLEYAGTPRQEVGAYGIKGKPVHPIDLSYPIQINKYDLLNEKYLPGHISAGYVGVQPSLTNRTSVNKTSRGTNRKTDYKADQHLFVYGSYLNPENVRPGFNLVTNNCADGVCDALSLSDRDGIETPSNVVEKLLNSQEHPSLDVTGRTYRDYREKLRSDKNILDDNAKYWLGIASSPDNKDLSERIIRTIQANLYDAGYELPKSRRAYKFGDFFGQFDGVFGDETKKALEDYQNKSKQPKDLGRVEFQNGGLKKYQVAGEHKKQFDLGVSPYTTVAESTGTQTPVFQSREDIEAQRQSRFFNQTVQEADRVAAITGDKSNYEQAQQTVTTGKQPEFVVNRDDPEYSKRTEAYRNKYGIEIAEPTALERLTNPMAQLEYYYRYGELPNRAQMDLEPTYGNPLDLAGAIYNPFSYVQSAMDAANAASKGNYGEAALSGLGVLPGYYGIQGAKALARQARPLVKDAGKFLTTQTPLKNAYNINPKSLKLNDVEILQRWHADKNPPLLPKGILPDKYTGKWYGSNYNIDNNTASKTVSGASTYMGIRPGSGEIRTAIVPKASANLPEELLSGPLSKNVMFPNQERILPEGFTYNATRVDKNPVDFTNVESMQNTIPLGEKLAAEAIPKPHWWKGYSLTKDIPSPKQLPGSPNATSSVDDVGKGLTQGQAVQARAERMLSQENKWVGQNNQELRIKFENAQKNHNPASDYPGDRLGTNKGNSTEVSKDALLSEPNKARIAAHETGHYYRNRASEADEWNSFFDFSKLEKHKTRTYLRGKPTATYVNSTNNISENTGLRLGKDGVPHGDEIRERAAQLKDYIAQKNNIPLNKDFKITKSQLDDAIKNYVKDTGLDNNMTQMLSSLKDKEGFLKAMNKYALTTTGAAIVAGAAAAGSEPTQIIAPDDLRYGGLVKYPNGGLKKYQTAGPIEYFEKPPLTSSDFDYTTGPEGNARFFSDPVTGEPFPLVNLPEAEIVETLNRDENGNIIFSGPEARDNYYAYKNLGEEGLKDMQAMKSGIRKTTGEFANNFLLPPAMVAGTVLGGASLIGPAARGASFLNTALQAPMQFGSRTIPGVTGYNILGAGFGIHGARSLSRDIDTGFYTDPNIPTSQKVERGAITGLDLLGTPGVGRALTSVPGALKTAGKFLTRQTPKQLPGSGNTSSADDIGKQFIKAANDRTMPMRPGLKDTTLEDEFLVLSEMSKVSNGRSVVPVHGYTDGNLIMDDLVSRGYVQVDEFIKQGGKINQTSINTLKNDINLWHNNNIIHGDLKSNNAFYNPKTQEIKLIDPAGYPKNFKSTNPKEYSEAIIKDIDDFDKMFPTSSVDDVGKASISSSLKATSERLAKATQGSESVLREILGELIRGKDNRAAIKKGNEWLENWIKHPTTQNKIDASIDDKKYFATAFLRDSKEAEELFELIRTQSKNFKPDSKEFSLLKQFDHNLQQYISKQNRGSIHTGNWGVSYKHGKSPEYRKMAEERTLPKGWEDERYGSWISRNRKMSQEKRTSTTIHEGTHDWVSAEAFEKSGMRNTTLKNTNPELKKDFLEWEMYRKFGIDPVKKMGKERAYNAYLADPAEVHARIMELRKGLSLTPNEFITPEYGQVIIDFVNSGSSKIDPAFLKVVDNDPKKLAELFNKLWAIPAAIVAGAAAAGSEPTDFKYGGPVKYPNGNEQLLTAQFGGMRRGKVNRILDDNRDLNFVDRMYQPNTPSIMIPGQDSPSTHFMESADGRVYPTVVQMPDGSLQYLGDDAYNYARATGEYIEFPNDRQAQRFAKSYKKGTGVLDEFSSGGLKQWFAEDWVDIKTGKKCGRGKDEKGRPYPACRPSNRVDETTPKTSNEMSASEKRKFRREKRSSKRINYNHKRNNR